MSFTVARFFKLSKSGKLSRRLFLPATITFLIAGILLVSYFRLLDRLELVSLDFRYSLRLRYPRATNPDIVLVEIGEDTLQSLGRWPLPRDYQAGLVEALSGFGARMILFDILFCEPTGWDTLFADMTRQAGNVYFPFVFGLRERYPPGLPQATGIDAPILKGLQEASRGIGFINKFVDMDGKVRRAPVLIEYQEKVYPSMAVRAACAYRGIDVASVQPAGKNRITFSDTTIPLDEEGLILLHYSGRWVETFTHYSFLDILTAYQAVLEEREPAIDVKALQGKVCFVGLTATGTQELGPIPIEKSYPMLGIHANLFNMLTRDIYLRRLGRFGNLAILILLTMGLFFLIRKKKPSLACLLSGLFIILVLVVATGLFVFSGLWVDVVWPVLVLVGVYLGITLVRFIAEIKTREKIQRELAVATSIQESFLPEHVPSIKGLEIAAKIKTAKEVGGDLYDFVALDEHRVGIMVGDVSGKGVPAALLMARIETLFRVYSKSSQVPSEVVSKLNQEIASDERSGLFTTLVYTIFDVPGKQLVFSDAGHLPIIVVHKNGEEESHFSEEGMAVGIMEETFFEDKAIDIVTGDTIVFYSDGVTEARDPKANEFGSDRLTDMLKRVRHLSAGEIVDSLFKDLRRFQGKAVQHDDITIIAVKVA